MVCVTPGGAGICDFVVDSQRRVTVVGEGAVQSGSSAPTYDANNFTLVFTGYYLAPQSGSYTFCIQADNRDALYIGSDSALPCGDASNGATPAGATPLADYFFDKTDSPNICQSIKLVAGFYYPIRSVYGNWGPPSSLGLTVQPPGGDATSNVEGNAFPNTCSA